MLRPIAWFTLVALILIPSHTWADEIDEQTAAQAVTQLLEKDTRDDIPRIWKLSQALAKGDRPAVPALRKALDDAKPAQGLAIARALVLLEEHTAGLQALRSIALNEDANQKIRVASVQIMGNEGELEEAEWLEDKIDDMLEPHVKLAMAKALWDLNRSSKKKGKNVMLAFMRSTDPNLKALGALALGEIGAVAEARTVLSALAEEPTERGRSARLVIRLNRMEMLAEQDMREDEPTDPTVTGAPIPASTGNWPLLDEIYAKLRSYYIDDSLLNKDKLEDAAAKGLTAALDPHTGYLSPEDNARLLEALDPTYGGVGAYVFNDPDNNKFFTISRPIYGGPIYKADLRAGDMVTMIAGKSTEGLSVEDCVRLLKGPPGTPVDVVVLRRGWEEAREFTLVRQRITIPTTAYDILPGKIGFLQIQHFAEDTAREVAKVLDLFDDKGVSALIIDLRYNTGGFLHSAVQIASNFLPKGAIVVKERGREGVYSGRSHFSVGTGGHRKQVPVAVIVNQGTASAAEILSGALKDHGVARLVGRVTFGKGSAQLPFDINSRPGEPFVDVARKPSSPGRGDSYTDLNQNDVWDKGEPFRARPRKNGRYDVAEKYEDANANGKWDEGEKYIDANDNGEYDPAEPFTDKNGNNEYDVGGGAKITIAHYYLPKGFNPKGEIKTVDGKVQRVGGIEPDVASLPKRLDLWEIQAQRALESKGDVRDYVAKLFDSDREKMERLARSDRKDPALYPGFAAFYDSLGTRLSKDAVRWLVRYHTRREVGDRLGRELVGDIVDDRQLQAAVLDLFDTLDRDFNADEDLAFLAAEIAAKEAEDKKKTSDKQPAGSR